MPIAIDEHPCFNAEARQRTARVHLPVAPACNLQCNYCNRQYSCVNESRPGVTAAVLSPAAALEYLDWSLEKDPRIKVVGIAGPGDPFANSELTMQTISLVRERHPELLLCIASNGLGLVEHIDELATCNVSHVTLTVNAVDPEVGARVYAWARYQKRMYRGAEAAALLLERQRQSIRALRQHGIIIKINTLIIPGINDHHVADVAKEVGELGASVQNCIPIYPVKGSAWEDIDPPSGGQVLKTRLQARQFLPQMSHCTRCRADAVGLLGETASSEFQAALVGASEPRSAVDRPYVAVASREGLLINQHLGEAQKLLIFGPTEAGDGYRVIDRRDTPTAGQGDQRWEQLGETLTDCRALLVRGVGGKPKRILAASGVEVFHAEGLIESALDKIYTGRPLPKAIKRMACGEGCGGDRAGCG